MTGVHLATDRGRSTWTRIKNVHLRRTGRLAEFPDCVAARSARHLRELAARTAVGERAVALFVVQRTDCDAFAPAADLDPAFAAALMQARGDGVEMLVYACDVTVKGVAITRRLPLAFADGGRP